MTVGPAIRQTPGEITGANSDLQFRWAGGCFRHLPWKGSPSSPGTDDSLGPHSGGQWVALMSVCLAQSASVPVLTFILTLCILTVTETACSRVPPLFSWGSQISLVLSLLCFFLLTQVGHLTALRDQENQKPKRVWFHSNFLIPQKKNCRKWKTKTKKKPTKYVYIFYFNIWRSSEAEISHC